MAGVPGAHGRGNAGVDPSRGTIGPEWCLMGCSTFGRGGTNFLGCGPPFLVGGGTPAFGRVMERVVPQFGVTSQFGSGVALGSPVFRPQVAPGMD